MTTAASVLARFPQARLLGEGAESQVFALSETRVLRVPKGGTAEFWARRRAFCDRLAGLELGFRTPVVVEAGDLGDLPYFIEERITGHDLTAALPRLDEAARERAFDSYLDAVLTLGTVPLDDGWYGEVLADDPVRAPAWPQFLRERALRCAADASPRVRADLPELNRRVAEFCADVQQLTVGPPTLVHGDFFPGNVIVDDAGTVVGAVAFLDITPGVRVADLRRVHDRAEALAPTAVSRASTYKRFYALSYLHALDDPPLYRWCVETLRSPHLL